VTSAAERACALVGNMLAAGPCDAAEIRAAAEGDNISERTMQRAAIALGVLKVKTGFAGGWIWRLPADDDEQALISIQGITQGEASVNEPQGEAIEMGLVKIKEPPSRAEIIAARLRKLEAGRGRVAPIYAGDPRVIRWADSGISDSDLREAYERAATDIRGTGPVTAGFLDPFVMQVIRETAPA
jgi:hypothetical protein